MRLLYWPAPPPNDDSDNDSDKDNDQPCHLGLLLPGHQLRQHVAHAENVREGNLETYFC